MQRDREVAGRLPLEGDVSGLAPISPQWEREGGCFPPTCPNERTRRETLKSLAKA